MRTSVIDRLKSTIDRYVVPADGCQVIDVKVPGIKVDDIRALSENFLGQACDISPAFAAWLQQQSEGNPLRLRSMLSLMVDQKLLTKEKGFLRLPTEFGESGAPPEVLVRSIDALRIGEWGSATELISISDSLRRFLEAGAVFGRQFPLALTTKLAGLRKSEEIDVLRDALRRGFIEESAIDTGKTQIPSGVFVSESHTRALLAQMPRAAFKRHHLAAAWWWEHQQEDIYTLFNSMWEGRFVDDLYHVQKNVLLSRVTNWAANISNHYLLSDQPLEALRTSVTCVSKLREFFWIENQNDKHHDMDKADHAAVHAVFRLINQLERNKSTYMNNVSWPETRHRIRELWVMYELSCADFYMDLEWYAMGDSSLREAELLSGDFDLEAHQSQLLLERARLAANTRHVRDEKSYLGRYLERLQSKAPSDSDIKYFLREMVHFMEWR